MDSQAPQPVAPVTATSDYFKLTERLEREARRFDGTNREHFVDQQSLCTSCRYSIIVRRRSQNMRVIQCGQLGKVVAEDIHECTSYGNINGLSLSQMVEIAYLIDPRKDRYEGYL